MFHIESQYISSETIRDSVECDIREEGRVILEPLVCYVFYLLVLQQSKSELDHVTTEPLVFHS